MLRFYSRVLVQHAYDDLIPGCGQENSKQTRPSLSPLARLPPSRQSRKQTLDCSSESYCYTQPEGRGLDENKTTRLLEAYNGKVAPDVACVQELLPELSLHWGGRFFLSRQHHRTKERRCYCCISWVQGTGAHSNGLGAASFYFTQTAASHT